MKTIATLILAATALPTFAQTITDRFEFGSAYRSALSIPKEFSYNGEPHLVVYDSNDNTPYTSMTTGWRRQRPSP